MLQSEYLGSICSDNGHFSSNLNNLALFVQMVSVRVEVLGGIAVLGINLLPRVEVDEVGRRRKGEEGGKCWSGENK